MLKYYKKVNKYFKHHKIITNSQYPINKAIKTVINKKDNSQYPINKAIKTVINKKDKKI